MAEENTPPEPKDNEPEKEGTDSGKGVNQFFDKAPWLKDLVTKIVEILPDGKTKELLANKEKEEKLAFSTVVDALSEDMKKAGQRLFSQEKEDGKEPEVGEDGKPKEGEEKGGHKLVNSAIAAAGLGAIAIGQKIAGPGMDELGQPQKQGAFRAFFGRVTQVAGIAVAALAVTAFARKTSAVEVATDVKGWAGQLLANRSANKDKETGPAVS